MEPQNEASTRSIVPPISKSIGGLCWSLRTPFPSELESILQNPETCFSNPERFIKNSRVVTLTRCHTNASSSSRLIVRRLNYQKPIHRLRDLFRSSRAQRAFRAAHLLERAGVPTPRAFAAADKRRCLVPVAAYLITEEIANARTLAHFLSEYRPRNAFVAEFAAAIAQLHQAGFSHRDLKLTNVILDANFHPYLIDLDGIRSLGSVTDRQAAKDLARLWLGLQSFPGKGRLAERFLVHYCRHRGTPFKVRPLADKILHHVR